jgi:group II intron reverse transcriptase/maturase
MRNPEKVLNSLTGHSTDSGYKFERLYRILFNEEMYFAAYQKIYKKAGSMTEGADGSTLDGMSTNRIKQIICSLKDESYQPAPSRRAYIPKKDGKKRPLGIPSSNDKLVQEVVRMILEAIYEGSFDDNSHGFRPKRSCHTALIGIQKAFSGVKWFIEGDIKGFYDNIDHDVLINILKERIADERFLRLIRKFLNAGYLEDWVFRKTYSGTPQGGIISPILANIYLDKLDVYVREYISRFDKGKTRKGDPTNAHYRWKKWYLSKKLREETDETERQLLIEEIRHTVQESRKYPTYLPIDENFRRLKYKRYADDFLLGVIGSKEDCVRIKEDISEFLRERLKLELSDSKTLITNASRPAKFLGFEVYVRKTNDLIKNSKGKPIRNLNAKVVLEVSADTIRRKLLEHDAVKITVINGKEVWKPVARRYMRHNDDLEIISQFNTEIRGLYNYYAIANNSYTLKSFGYIMEYSMYKSYANKYATNKKKIIRKYKKNGVFSIPFNRKGKTLYREFYRGGFKRQTTSVGTHCDSIPNTLYTGSTNSLIVKLQAQECELCGANCDLEMHHVRKLKDLKGKQDWEKKMISRRRKTLAVCPQCHDKIHSGTLD